MTINDMVLEALQPTEAIIAAEWERQLHVEYNQFKEILERDGMNAAIAFGYPDSNMGRKSYMVQLARRNYCEKHTTAVQGGPQLYMARKTNDPRMFRPGSTDGFKAIAAKGAKDSLASFSSKLTLKIEAELKRPLIKPDGGGYLNNTAKPVAAKFIGGTDPWGHSHVLITLDNSTTQLWKTRMIINVSCLGKVFNQFPTRLVK